MNKEQVIKIIHGLNDQGFLALDENITSSTLIAEVQALMLNRESQILKYLNDNGHLCVDDDQYDEVLEFVENIDYYKN